MNSTIVEYIEGIEVIKAFGRAGTSYEKYSKAILDYKKFVVKWLSSTWITMKITFALFPSTLPWNLAGRSVSDNSRTAYDIPAGACSDAVHVHGNVFCQDRSVHGEHS